MIKQGDGECFALYTSFRMALDVYRIHKGLRTIALQRSGQPQSRLKCLINTSDNCSFVKATVFLVFNFTLYKSFAEPGKEDFFFCCLKHTFGTLFAQMKPTKYILVAITTSLLFSCKQEGLPSIEIRKEGTIGWVEKEACTIVYSDTKNTDELPGKIKCRGGMSSKYYKHSFSLELEEKYSFANLPNDDDWIINANYIDKTFMRHKISYDLFREMNAKNVASKSTYVNVKINDQYEGLYVLMEKVNAGMIGLNKRDTFAMLFKDPPVFGKKPLAYVKDSSNYYQQKFPKIDVSDKTYYIEEFKNFIFNSSDSAFAQNISNWVDIENVIDWHIILLFSNNSDGILKNFYLYKLDKNTPFRFAIWDYDHSFGRDGDNERNMMERELDCNISVLFERLSSISDTGYLPRLQKRWFELRENKTISIENFEKHIAENDNIIRNEVLKNISKWPTDSKWYYDDNNYIQELNLMRDFVKSELNSWINTSITKLH